MTSKTIASLKSRMRLNRHMRVFSHTTPEERIALFELARALPEGARAMEIGSHIGSSALFLCEGLRHSSGHLLCVDTWMNETMPDGEKDTFAEFTANVRPYADMITPIRKRSDQLSQDDVGSLLDFVFLDGDHSEGAVRRDLATVTPWLKHGGRLAFHDVNMSFPGVHVVIGEALASRQWELIGMAGFIAVLKRTGPQAASPAELHQDALQA